MFKRRKKYIEKLGMDRKHLHPRRVSSKQPKRDSNLLKTSTKLIMTP